MIKIKTKIIKKVEEKNKDYKIKISIVNEKTGYKKNLEQEMSERSFQTFRNIVEVFKAKDLIIIQEE